MAQEISRIWWREPPLGLRIPLPMADATTPDAIGSETIGGSAPPRQAPAESAEAGSSRDEAQVHAAGTYNKGVLRWGYFLLLNAIAGSVAIAFFIGVFYAEGLDPYLQGTYDWLLAHPGVTSFLAFSPLACSLLVGWGYSQRAKKRKLAAKRAEAKAEPKKSPTEQAPTAQEA